MAKGVYIGVGGVAKKVKKIYFGVGGVARKVKKAYIGVGGVARCFWSGGEVAYYGNAPDMTTGREWSATASIGNYALIAGGSGEGGELASVETYNKSLTHSTATDLKEAREYFAGASNGSYAVFGGGYGSTRTNAVDAYNASLTHSTPTTLGTSRQATSATSVGNYVLIAGGYGSSSSTRYTAVDAFDKSLTKTLVNLENKAHSWCAGTVDKYAIFACGKQSYHTTLAECFDSSLTAVTITAPSVSTTNGGSASTGKHVVFAGGYNYSSYSSMKNVIAYDKSLTLKTCTSLSFTETAGGFVGTAVDGFALFAKEIHSSDDTTEGSCVFCYDESLVMSKKGKLETARDKLFAASIGSYALFGGGEPISPLNTYFSTVEVYTC